MKLFSSKRTFKKIILSYISVLIIPFVFGITLYFSTVNMYSKDVDAANSQVLNNVRDNINVTLSGMSSMIQTLFNEQNVVMLSTKADYSNFDYVAMNNLQKKLEMSVMSNNYIDEIMIYFHKSDFLLTSKDYLNHTQKMTGYSNIIGLTVNGFISQLRQNNDFEVDVLDEERGKSVFMSASDGNNDRSYSPNSTVLIRLKKELINARMVTDNSDTFLIDGDGTYISSSKSDMRLDAKNTWALINPDGKNMVIRNMDDTFEIQYVRFMPNEIYFKNLFLLQVLATLFVLLSLLLGVPVAISIAQRSYNPIKNILALIPHSSGDREIDDYKVISSSITELLQRNRDNEFEKDTRLASIRNYIFFRALEDPTLDEKTFLAECKKAGVGFMQKCFLMIGFSIENGSNLFFADDENANGEMSQLLFIAITNILREILGANYLFFTAEYKGHGFAVLNIDSRLDKAVVTDEVKNYCEQLSFRLDNDFRAIVSVTISTVHMGFAELGDCYGEIRRADAEQSKYKRSAYVVQYDELFSLKRDSSLPQIGEQEDEIQEKRSKKSYSIQGICRFIDSNYANTELTVASISEKFDITTANLSLYFKRKKGISPLEYIQMKRVEKAKRLLETTDMKISDIARTVGYFDTRPLMRSFKRIEGKSPAEYRDEIKAQGGLGC